MSDWRPTAPREAIQLRAALNRLVREFFHARGVLEVETPILSAHGTTDVHIESLRATFDGPARAGVATRWLRTSPEFALKRLLASDIGDCYELGRVFRDGEAGRRHNPEFTLLEWYRVGWDHRRLMDEVAALIGAALALVSRRAAVRTLSYRQWFIDGLGLDPHTCTIDVLKNTLSDTRIDGADLTRDDWLDLVITHRLEATHRDDELLLIHDYPATQAALARIRDGDPPVAERFEAYLGRVELANGYHELLDVDEQRARFARDADMRRARAQREVPADTNLLAALAHGLPSCAGVALGVDRLLMALAGSDDIEQVIAFPFSRA
jgi:elongation factor P--(R)-beta-lysine ligase